MPNFVATAIIDSYLNGFEDNDNTNYGTSTDMRVGDYGIPKNTLGRAIINYDISELSGETLVSAKMLLGILSPIFGEDMDCLISRCTRPDDWVETEVTWNDYKDDTPWTVAGGDKDATTPTPVAFTGPTEVGVSFEISPLLAFAQDALDNRNGVVSVIIEGNTEANGFHFASRTYQGTVNPSEFVVTYEGAVSVARRRYAGQTLLGGAIYNRRG